MDFGIDAANKTIEILAARGSQFVGFGDSLDSARAPLKINYKGKVIALFSVCETQYGEAGANLPGLSFIGPWIFDAISKVKSESDFVIVLFHGGLEDATWSAPWTQELLRSYVDAGANLVIAHHPHKPQSPERYRDGLIYYSLGNFCTYGMFNLDGPNGVAPLLTLNITEKGEFISAKVTSIFQQDNEHLAIDPTGKAFQILRELTQNDIPEAALQFSEDGIITKKSLKN
jgi:hypothetical protein